MEYYYIRFDYDHYCQGWEEETETLMVQADNYSYACELIGLKYKNARNFQDLTLRFC